MAKPLFHPKGCSDFVKRMLMAAPNVHHKLSYDFLAVLDDDAFVAGRCGCTTQHICKRF